MDLLKEEFVKGVASVAIGLLILGLVVYCLILLAYVFSKSRSRSTSTGQKLWLVNLVEKEWPDHAFEIPMSGGAAFAIVSLLSSYSEGNIKFEAFSLKFDGPAGPTTLWVVVYLSIVASLKILKK